jgi:hypothetical protein
MNRKAKSNDRLKAADKAPTPNQHKEQKEPLNADPEDFLDLRPPSIPRFLDNVLHVFVNGIPEDARPKCRIEATGLTCPVDGDGKSERTFLLEFVRERLDMVSRREYGLWLNGRLPFITPRELLLWRLRQYVEYIWAFQLPDDDDLALIFNTTKLRASHVASDFTARFRKALLFPIALRRLYRILRDEDATYKLLEQEQQERGAYGSTFMVPARRYLQDANSLINELRLRVEVFLRDAVLISKTENILWVHNLVLEQVGDDRIRRELFSVYERPREVGYEG